MMRRRKVTRRMNFCALFTAALFSFVLAGCSPSQPGSESGSAARAKIAWLTDYDAALAQARSDGKSVAIDFFATWCSPCKTMERNTFTDTEVQQRVAGFVPLKVDVGQQQQLAARYGIEGLPTTLVVDATGKPVARAVGYLDAKDFLAVLDAARSGTARTDSTQ